MGVLTSISRGLEAVSTPLGVLPDMVYAAAAASFLPEVPEEPEKPETPQFELFSDLTELNNHAIFSDEAVHRFHRIFSHR